ncbi:MAG: hypothetical protein K9H64_06250 [Bacteroidales bacterium]|nr:hypothetical protein [Bacteroidales bacterium]MCF8455297.1 hypothetical protein [Bacteroidales bacterium]
MAKKLANIILSLWMVAITAGILVNHHFSDRNLFSTNLYIEAESCCQISGSGDAGDVVCEISETGYSCHKASECLSCCNESLDKEVPLGQFTFQQSDCCSQDSTFFQLAQVFFPNKSLKTFEIPFGPLSSFAVMDLYSTLKISLIKPGHSPPFLIKTPIYINIASFRC